MDFVCFQYVISFVTDQQERYYYCSHFVVQGIEAQSDIVAFQYFIDLVSCGA